MLWFQTQEITPMETKIELIEEELIATQKKMVDMEASFNQRIEELTIYFQKMINAIGK